MHGLGRCLDRSSIWIVGLADANSYKAIRLECVRAATGANTRRLKTRWLSAPDCWAALRWAHGPARQVLKILAVRIENVIFFCM